MSLETNISLLVATLDLKMVKGIRDAIRTADIASGKCFPVTAIGPAPNCCLGRGDDCFEHRRHIEPQPVYEPRRHIHPTPRYEPRPVIHPTPRIAAECKPMPVCPEVAPEHKLLPEPPWKCFPWKNPTPAPEFIKKIVQVNDKKHRGQILDLFI